VRELEQPAKARGGEVRPPFLEVRGIRKTFGGNVALDGVDLSCRRGEVHALVGENGAGKSTLIQVLTGVHRADEGEILVEGRPAHFRNPRDAEEASISAVYQELSLIEELDVAQNVYLHREPRRWKWFLARKALYTRCADLLRSLHIDVDPRAPVASLSLARRQLVELAKALFREPVLVIMDEPTASLSIKEQEHLFDLLNDLKTLDIGVLYVSHRLEEIFHIADLVTVLRDGRLIRTLPVSDIEKDDLVQLMVGRSLALNLYPPRTRPPGPIPDEQEGEAPPLLEVRALTSTGRFRDVSFDLHAGEIVGIAGLVGSGRSSLLRAIFGADPIGSGSVRLRGRTLKLRSPREATRAGIAMISEDRKHEGLAPALSNLANIEATFLPASMGFYRRKEARASAGRAARDVQLRAGLDSPTQLLSGGNQQKVALAKWIALSPAVLLCDEPTRGIDVGAKAEIYRLLRDQADLGVAVLLASSELPEVLGLADRILVMREGSLVAEFQGQTATEELVMQAAAGPRDRGHAEP
jgi:ABC-type sugar transport system ATPase subunit